MKRIIHFSVLVAPSVPRAVLKNLVFSCGTKFQGSYDVEQHDKEPVCGTSPSFSDPLREEEESQLPLITDHLNHLNDRGTEIAKRAKQTALCLEQPYTIISSRVRFDLIFCLVFIKQLLHYLISQNQVKRWDRDQCMSAKKAFEHSLAKLAHKYFFYCSGAKDRLFDAPAELQNGKYFWFWCPSC